MPIIKKYISKQKKQIHKQKIKTKKRNLKSKSNIMRGGSEKLVRPVVTSNVGRAKPVEGYVGRPKPVESSKPNPDVGTGIVVRPKQHSVDDVTLLYYQKVLAKQDIKNTQKTIKNTTQADFAVRGPARKILPQRIKTYEQARAAYYKALSKVPTEVRKIVLTQAKAMKDKKIAGDSEGRPFMGYK